MTVISLFIPDVALCAAITEQLTMAGYETTDGLGAAESVALIVDADADKKIWATFTKEKCVFLLGEKPNNQETDCVTEAFTKPIRLGHLLERLRFYLETAPRLRNNTFHFGPYQFIPHNRQIIVESTGAVIRLTQKETALLEYLCQNDKHVDRNELLAAIWGYDARIDTHTLETHIYQLRRKLDPEGTGGDWLMNEAGSYRLQRQKA